MNKEFIPYEQALELKELGFNENCLAFYNFGERLMPIDTDFTNFRELSDDLTKAPLYQQAFRWFREKVINRIQFEKDYIEGQFLLLPLVYFNKYEIHVTPLSTSSFPTQYGDFIPYYEFPSRRKIYTSDAKSYEEAERMCLIKLIEIAKNK